MYIAFIIGLFIITIGSIVIHKGKGYSNNQLLGLLGYSAPRVGKPLSKKNKTILFWGYVIIFTGIALSLYPLYITLF